MTTTSREVPSSRFPKLSPVLYPDPEADPEVSGGASREFAGDKPGVRLSRLVQCPPSTSLAAGTVVVAPSSVRLLPPGAVGVTTHVGLAQQMPAAPAAGHRVPAGADAGELVSPAAETEAVRSHGARKHSSVLHVKGGGSDASESDLAVTPEAAHVSLPADVGTRVDSATIVVAEQSAAGAVAATAPSTEAGISPPLSPEVPLRPAATSVEAGFDPVSADPALRSDSKHTKEDVPPQAAGPSPPVGTGRQRAAVAPAATARSARPMSPEESQGAAGVHAAAVAASAADPLAGSKSKRAAKGAHAAELSVSRRGSAAEADSERRRREAAAQIPAALPVSPKAIPSPAAATAAAVAAAVLVPAAVDPPVRGKSRRPKGGPAPQAAEPPPPVDAGRQRVTEVATPSQAPPVVTVVAHSPMADVAPVPMPVPVPVPVFVPVFVSAHAGPEPEPLDDDGSDEEDEDRAPQRHKKPMVMAPRAKALRPKVAGTGTGKLLDERKVVVSEEELAMEEAAAAALAEAEAEDAAALAAAAEAAALAAAAPPRLVSRVTDATDASRTGSSRGGYSAAQSPAVSPRSRATSRPESPVSAREVHTAATSPRSRGDIAPLREATPSPRKRGSRERSPRTRVASPRTRDRSPPRTRDRSPRARERSSHTRERSPRDRSPRTRERSPPQTRDASPRGRDDLSRPSTRDASPRGRDRSPRRGRRDSSPRRGTTPPRRTRHTRDTDASHGRRSIDSR